MADTKEILQSLKYTKDHEWVQINNDIATVGITDYAQSSLGDITYVELPKNGTLLTEGSTAGAVESVKAASDIYSPLSGSVIETNEQINNQPELVNSSPYQQGWLFKIKLTNTSEINNLLDPSSYKNLVEGI